jgi:transcriptional regulator with XRE-family HTH domain
MDESSLGRHENGGVRNPQWVTLRDLADALGTSLDYLMGRVDSYDLHRFDTGFAEIRKMYVRNSHQQRRKMVASVRRHDDAD